MLRRCAYIPSHPRPQSSVLILTVCKILKMATSSPKPKLATLPLPRELREHVYGYLLRTDTFFVRNIYAGGSASLLPLQVFTRPAILDVSMSTRQEAKRALYRNGEFLFDAFLALPPPPFDGIKDLPGIGLLQKITLHFDTGINAWYSRYPIGVTTHTDAVGSATKLVDHFANLCYSVPRTRLVVNLIADSIIEDFLGAGDDAGNFKDALSRLTGFKKVEVKMSWDEMRYPLSIFPLVQQLDKNLTMTLGDGEIDCEEGFEGGRSCLVYHPRNR